MNSLWDEQQASLMDTDLAKRIYSTRLLGTESEQVMPIGSSCSVKTEETSLSGGRERVLYVSQQGADLANIEATDFTPLRLGHLQEMADAEQISDLEMVKFLRLAMLNPDAPQPSIEAMLHAVIPCKYVALMPADAIVTLSCSQDGNERLLGLFGERVVVAPFIKPGASQIKLLRQMLVDLDWNGVEGLVLMNQGLVTFADDASTAYRRCIALISEAESYLTQHAPLPWPALTPALQPAQDSDFTKRSRMTVCALRFQVCQLRGEPVLALANHSELAVRFSMTDLDARSLGAMTPHQVIHCRAEPAVLGDEPADDISAYAQATQAYFEEQQRPGLKSLGNAPQFAVFRQGGSLAFGRSIGEARLVEAMSNHYFLALLRAEQLGGYCSLSPEQAFTVAYSELEQVRWQNLKPSAPLQGRIALVSGASRPLAQACIRLLLARGASVVAISSEPSNLGPFGGENIHWIQANLANPAERRSSVEQSIDAFGGLDIVVSFAEDAKTAALVSECTPFLRLGWLPRVLILQQQGKRSRSLVVEPPISVHSFSYPHVGGDGGEQQTELALLANLALELLCTPIKQPLSLGLQPLMM